MDLVNIGFKAQTGDMDKADKKLNALAVTGGKVDGTFSSLQKTIGVVGAAMTALGVAKVSSDLLGYSEAWKMVNNELKIVIDSEEQLIATRTKLLAISKATVSELSSTTALYAELYRNTRDLKIEEESILNVTKTLNNLFVAGAKDANTQASAIRQLSQALGTGALRGDEYISVTEAAPRIIDALAESLNMAKGEMRAFAATGGITSEILIKALTDYSDTAQSLFDKTDKTFEQSMQNAQTNAIEYAGEMEGLGDVIDSLGVGIEDLSEDIDSLVDAGGALVAVVGVGLTPAMYRYVASLAATTTAQLTAGTTATVTANAFGMVTRTAATATIATNALGVATRFLLGPFGLLLTAVGVASAVFISSKNSSDEFAESLRKQTAASDELLASMQNISKQELKDKQIEENQKHIDLLYKRAELESKIAKFSNVDRGGASRIEEWSEELKSVNSQIDITAKNLDNIADKIMEGVNFNSPFEKAAEDAKFATSEYKKWLDTVNGFQTPLEKAIEKVAKFNEALAAGKVEASGAALNYLKNASEELAALNVSAENSAYKDWLDEINESSREGQLASIAEEINKVKQAMNMGSLSQSVALEYLDELEKKANDLKGALSGADIFNGLANGAKEGLASIQSLSEQGSDEYAKLGVAIQAVTALQAVQAVVNQAAGANPYESFAKMAAMASAIGALGVSVGNATGGGFSDSAANNQESQGLNVWGEKSTSIANGIESIQDSSSDLVIINSGMLTALESLSAGISAASAQSLQGYKAQTLDVSSSLYNNKIEDFINQSIVMSLTGGISSFMPFITSGLADLISPFTGVISGFLGGSSKNTDSGFRISGGSLGDLSDSANVDAFSETQYRTWRYGSTRTRTAYQDLDEASIQFALVFDSLATSVYEGAISLGMSAVDAEQAINDYYIATTKISLKGLSAEEQAAEIESVFSSIFDGVSGAVIPYLGEFQQVGEGLGDTLSRLSTEVSLTEAYADILGFTLSDKLADPYMFATISDNLATLSGGLEGFSANLSSFVDSFASDDIKLSIATETMQNALSELGLSLPSTTDGFYQLMQGLDATTEAGQAQIAGLLSLTDTAENYYSLLDNTLGSFNDSLQSVSDSLMSAIDTIYGVTYEQATTSLDEALMLARAGSYDAALGLDLTSIAPTESNFSNATEFKLEQAKTSNKLSELADLTGTTKTTAEYQLSESINQTTLLSELKEQQAKMNAKLNDMIATSSESASALLNFELDAMNVRIVT